MDGTLGTRKASLGRDASHVKSEPQGSNSLQHDSPLAPKRQAKWQAANPLARWSHIAVQSALRRGILIRQCCEVCGSERTDAHHDDHRKPLDVRWLCRRHHSALHSERRKAGGN